MNTDICDICNKPIKAQTSLTGGIKLQYRIKIKSIEEGFTMAGWFRKTRNLDVCPDCMNKFAKFVEEGGAVYEQNKEIESLKETIDKMKEDINLALL